MVSNFDIRNKRIPCFIRQSYIHDFLSFIRRLGTFMFKHYHFTFSFSFVSLCIHFITLKKKNERELFYSIVCIQHSLNFSNGDTRW